MQICKFNLAEEYKPQNVFASQILSLDQNPIPFLAALTTDLRKLTMTIPSHSNKNLIRGVTVQSY